MVDDAPVDRRGANRLVANPLVVVYTGTVTVTKCYLSRAKTQQNLAADRLVPTSWVIPSTSPPRMYHRCSAHTTINLNDFVQS